MPYAAGCPFAAKPPSGADRAGSDGRKSRCLSSANSIPRCGHIPIEMYRWADPPDRWHACRVLAVWPPRWLAGSRRSETESRKSAAPNCVGEIRHLTEPTWCGVHSNDEHTPSTLTRPPDSSGDGQPVRLRSNHLRSDRRAQSAREYGCFESQVCRCRQKD